LVAEVICWFFFLLFCKVLCTVLFGNMNSFLVLLLHCGVCPPQHVFLGAVPFRWDIPRLIDLGVRAVVTLTEPFETLVPTSSYQVKLISSCSLPFGTDICLSAVLKHF
jgi:hypothetical protein